jgi:AcrR family transcriptional regulator
VTRSDDIRATAIGLFAERGYRGTSMKDIAAAVGMRAPSLYNHLQSKQDLLQEVVVGTMQELERSVSAVMSSSHSMVGGVRRGTEAHVLHHAEFPDEVRIGNREIPSLEEPARGEFLALRHRYQGMWVSFVERGKDEGVFLVDSPKLTVFAILAMGIGVASWFRPDGELSASEIAARFGDIAVLMVGPVEGGQGNGGSSAMAPQRPFAA